jgi:hypothetical protein
MTSSSVRPAVLTAIALVAIAALLVMRAGRPPAPVPATAPATEFSAERAVAHVREIAQRPHPAGSPDNARVRAYLIDQLRALELDPQVQEATGVGTRYPEAGRIHNVLARLPGRTPGGLGVVLLAHYDGVGGGPAAGDDAAGTAAILETLRALRAGPPLAHDVIAVITDGEEGGLLGAAAFVREHPWARDVGITLNFEARGTRGRSYMFETGPGNLDVARVLRTAGNVSATSLSVTVYRSLPNDTDLSEMAVLAKPALNFAFADGVERYHTAHDDVAHLDLGSVQHHGSQMLTLTRAFADGPLPRPPTGDAVFFDLPVVGLVVYPESWAWPIAIAAIALVLATILRVTRRTPHWVRDVVIGAGMTVISTALAAGVTMLAGNAIARAHTAMVWGGAPAFRGVYTAALAVLALAIALGGWALARRWASTAGTHAGALIVWSALTVLVTWKLPGVSFMFVWPLVAVAVAGSVAARAPAADSARTPGTTVALWAATVVAMAVMVPLVYSVSAVLLGAVGPGGIATGILVSLLAWLLGPHLEAISADRRWATAGIALAAGVCLIGVGMATVRSSPEHPTPSLFTYALDTDGSGAWLVTNGPFGQVVTSADTTAVPTWLSRMVGSGGSVKVVPAPRAQLDGPTATVVSDSTTAGERRVVLRVRAPSGTEMMTMRADSLRVLRASIDGRAIDTSRYRRVTPFWRLGYSAPPDSGVVLALTVPATSTISLDLTARTPGVPSLPDVRLPARVADVVTAQTGDVTLARRTVRIP